MWSYLETVLFIYLWFTQEVKKRGLKVAVAGIPKTIDNDISVHLLACLTEHCCCVEF